MAVVAMAVVALVVFPQEVREVFLLAALEAGNRRHRAGYPQVLAVVAVEAEAEEGVVVIHLLMVTV